MLRVWMVLFVSLTGMYLSDLTYIDSAYPSTGSILENEQRSNLMNNILRIISDLQRSCEYDIPVLPHVQKYLNSVRYIEELQKFVEDDNYKLSLKIEPGTSTPRSTASREDLVGPDASASPLCGRRGTAAEGALSKVPPTPPSPRNLLPCGHRKCHSLGYNATFPNAGSRHLLDDSVMESHTPARGQAESSTLSSGISLGQTEGCPRSSPLRPSCVPLNPRPSPPLPVTHCPFFTETSAKRDDKSEVASPCCSWPKQAASYPSGLMCLPSLPSPRQGHWRNPAPSVTLPPDSPHSDLNRTLHRFYHSLGPVTRVARIPYRGVLKASRVPERMSGSESFGVGKGRDYGCLREEEWVGELHSAESEELAVHLYPGAVTVQGVLRRKTLLKEGRKPTVASWTKYWVALCGTQLFYYPAKSLKATERKHFKSTSSKSTSVVGWMAMMADDPEHPDVFLLTDSEHGENPTQTDARSAEDSRPPAARASQPDVFRVNGAEEDDFCEEREREGEWVVTPQLRWEPSTAMTPAASPHPPNPPPHPCHCCLKQRGAAQAQNVPPLHPDPYRFSPVAFIRHPPPEDGVGDVCVNATQTSDTEKFLHRFLRAGKLT
ncbi:hypothetical protein JZ751_024848, partial [Albula glossodonta]